jgi:hypothetical protein
MLSNQNTILPDKTIFVLPPLKSLVAPFEEFADMLSDALPKKWRWRRCVQFLPEFQRA